MNPRIKVSGGLPHPAYICSGPQLDQVIAELETGRTPQPGTAPWREDLPPEQAERLARACGATEESITAAKRGEFR